MVKNFWIGLNYGENVSMSYETVLDDILDYVKKGLTTDGEHHKQYYLYQIAETLLSEEELDNLEEVLDDHGMPP